MKENHPTKILFVCAQNKIRSVTAEKMFSGSQRYQVRSRGIASDARVKLTAGDIGWADVIFVMEKNLKNIMAKRLREEIRSERIVCLFIEDIYEPMEEALIVELRRKLAPHLILPEEKQAPASRSVGSRAPRFGTVLRGLTSSDRRGLLGLFGEEK